ncbi:GTP-binding protein REM 1-like isoform X2 [Ostrea edulis]|nr:GTP-binding protein REM 1-like isoform X2 [Ostrea edulis]
MEKTTLVYEFLDLTDCEDFPASKTKGSLSVPCTTDARRNSNTSCETSSSYMSESNENLGDFCCPSPTYSQCDSLSLSEILHVSVLGAQGVGKRSLLHQFTDTEDQFTDTEDMWRDLMEFETGGTEICVSLDGKETPLMFVEQIPFENVRVCAYMDAIVVMYSVVDMESFRLANKIIEEIRKHFQKPIFLVANKVDLERKRVVFTKDGEKLATRFGCKYVEMSLILNHNVDDLLVGIVRQTRLQPIPPMTSKTEKERNKVQKLTKRLRKRWRKLRTKRKPCTNLFDL